MMGQRRVEQAALFYEFSLERHSRTDGTFSREEFAYDAKRDIYICPGGKPLSTLVPVL